MELSKSHGSHQGAAHQADDEVCEIGDADANSIRGEALFLRAPFHFEAWKMWRNIPYYTEEDADFRKPNTGANAIPLILADLDAAIGLLPDASRNGQVGRVSSWTAKACKGRVQVYSSDYAGALTTLRDVRDSGPHALEDGFHQDWTGPKDFANGPEAILVYQASVNNGNPNGDNGNWGERLNFPHGGSPFGCCGFHQPSQNLVNFFRVDADGLPLALTDAAWNASDANFDTTATAPVDPRLDWAVMAFPSRSGRRIPTWTGSTSRAGSGIWPGGRTEREEERP